MVPGDSQEEVMIFRDTQTHRHFIIIYISQGLAGLWGYRLWDTVRPAHYKVFSTSHFAPTALSSDWILLFKCGYKNSLVIAKIPLGTIQNYENPPVNTKKHYKISHFTLKLDIVV